MCFSLRASQGCSNACSSKISDEGGHAVGRAVVVEWGGLGRALGPRAVVGVLAVHGVEQHQAEDEDAARDHVEVNEKEVETGVQDREGEAVAVVVRDEHMHNRIAILHRSVPAVLGRVWQRVLYFIDQPTLLLQTCELASAFVLHPSR